MEAGQRDRGFWNKELQAAVIEQYPDGEIFEVDWTRGLKLLFKLSKPGVASIY